MRYITLLLSTIAIVSLVSCKTYINFTPSFSDAEARDFSLKNPIMIAIKDSRTNKKDGSKPIDGIKSDFTRIYGNNIKFMSYSDTGFSNSIFVKINIKEIGSGFGLQRFDYQSYYNQVNSVTSIVSTQWGASASTLIYSQPVVVSNSSIEGYWTGRAYLEISIIDKIKPERTIYQLPFFAEDKQPNTWGYRSGRLAVENSWSSVSNRILRFIDFILVENSK